MEPCICKASIMIENNKDLICKGNIHVCICDFNCIKCMSDRHNCICKTHMIDTYNCNSLEHYCICKDTISANCRLVNSFNTQLNCYIKKHECICYKSSRCLCPAHKCICKEMPFRCKNTEAHFCSCKFDHKQCKAIKHKKPCFIIRFFRWIKTKLYKRKEPIRYYGRIR